MGLLTTGGPPMVWGTPENDKAIPYVRKHGITQFLHLLRKYRPVKDAPFLWGEEVEHLVTSFEPEATGVKLSLTADPNIDKQI